MAATDHDRASTLGGVLAILLWSTTIAISRGLTESLGVFSAGAYCYLLAGGVAVLYALGRKRSGTPPPPLPRAYLLWCGSLFVVYQLSLYLAIGLAAGGRQVVEVGLLNYLWPVLTLVLSIPILKLRARWWVVPGFALALGGIALAMSAPPGSAPDPAAGVPATPLAVPLLALAAAASWALYSNLARKFAASAEGNAAPLFFLVSGALMLVLRFVFGEHSRWTAASALSVAYMGLLPGLVAYTLWDRAMRRGDLVLVTVLSYFAPLLSTLITCLCLKVLPGWNVWAACVLLIAGALLSRWSLGEPAP